MGEANKLSGGCLCGAVRFTASPETHNYTACHCDMCTKVSGGTAYLSLHCGPDVEIEDDTQIGIYSSSHWAERHFCKNCGTPLFYKFKKTGEHGISVGVFDNSDDFEMVTQYFTDTKPAHYSFSNETKNMTRAEVFAAFAPSNDGGKNV